MHLSLVSVIALTLTTIGFGVGAYVLAVVPSTPRPAVGSRGAKRAQALQAGGSFAGIEPAMRRVAGWVTNVPLGRMRTSLDRWLVHAGEPLGLSAEETIALSLLGATAFGGLGGALAAVVDGGAEVAALGALLGASLPYVRLGSDRTRRRTEIDRGLPAAIDLASLSMGAGLDFPGALTQVVGYWGREDALHEELSRVLRQLEIGHTRRQALLEFESRCPTDAVRSFVGAVVQAEEKGTPLAEVLRIQAGMLRMRRTVKAEEAAARAGVLMMGPLVLLLIAILLLLLGPFIVSAVTSGW